MSRTPYPSSLTDARWQLVAPLVPPPRPGGRPAKYDRREIVDGILYVARTGCSWRSLPTDLPAINAMSEVAADVFHKLGMNMDYQALDWATVAQRLLSQEPLDKGGWSLNANYAPGFSAMSPAAHSFTRGIGRQALFGWPTMPKVEELRAAWIDTTDPDEQKRICREIQLQAFHDVPYIPLGSFFFAAAYRKDLTGILKGGVAQFTNMRRG